MSKNTDVFVVGGGPAGLAAAIAARQRGFEVTIADGARPPVDKACGEGLMPDTLSALQNLGISLNASDGFPFQGLRFWDHNTSAEADFPEEHGLGVRRVLLHQMLLERAEGLGVRFLWETPVVGISNDEVLIADGTVRARWILGADGVLSRVRRWCGLEGNARGTRRYASRRHYRVDPWSTHVEVYWGEGSQAYVTAVGKDSVCVVLVSHDPRVRLSSLEKEFPELASRLRGAERISLDRGAITVTRHLQSVYRGAVALVGDASGSVDAITGDGLRLSFRQATALAAAMEAGDLRDYQNAHRRIARRPRWMAHLLLLLDGHPALRRRLINTLAAHPEGFGRLLRVHVGEASAMQIASAGTLLGWYLMNA